VPPAARSGQHTARNPVRGSPAGGPVAGPRRPAGRRSGCRPVRITAPGARAARPNLGRLGPPGGTPRLPYSFV